MGKGCRNHRCDDISCDEQHLSDAATEELLSSSSADSSSPPSNDIEEIVFVNDISELDVIQNEAVQLAVWRQDSGADADNTDRYNTDTPAFITKLQDLSIDPSCLPVFEDTVFCGYDVRQRLTAKICPRWSLRSKSRKALTDEEAKDFIDEISNLVHTFGEICRSDAVYVKLQLVDNDSCAYWHQDCVDFRLVKTYRGPCTEYVHPEHSDATLSRYTYNSKHARSLTNQDVALFKGRGQTEVDDDHLNQPGIVHRSPRIPEDSDIVRLVLVLDVPLEGMHY